MNKIDYEYLMDKLRAKLKDAHGYSGNKKEVFCEGVRAAMSMLSAWYHEQEMLNDEKF